ERQPARGADGAGRARRAGRAPGRRAGFAGGERRASARGAGPGDPGGQLMRVWAIANQKGGVGKTTTTLALGRSLVARGRRVLLVDLDPHASLTRAFGV